MCMQRGSQREALASLCGVDTLAVVMLIYPRVSPALNTTFAKCDAITCLGFSPATIVILKLGLQAPVGTSPSRP